MFKLKQQPNGSNSANTAPNTEPIFFSVWNLLREATLVRRRLAKQKLKSSAKVVKRNFTQKQHGNSKSTVNLYTNYDINLTFKLDETVNI